MDIETIPNSEIDLVGKIEKRKFEDFVKNPLDKETLKGIINKPSSNSGKTPLTAAIIPTPADGSWKRAKEDIFKVVKTLLKAGANPNIPDKDGNTPLMLALYTGNIEVFKLLLEQGANPNQEDRFGNLPLVSAIIGIRFSDLLSFVTSDPIQEDIEGRFNLDEPNRPNFEAIKLLLNAKHININQSDYLGRIPLIAALDVVNTPDPEHNKELKDINFHKLENIKILKQLFAKGASINVVYKDDPEILQTTLLMSIDELAKYFAYEDNNQHLEDQANKEYKKYIDSFIKNILKDIKDKDSAFKRAVESGCSNDISLLSLVVTKNKVLRFLKDLFSSIFTFFISGFSFKKAQEHFKGSRNLSNLIQDTASMFKINQEAKLKNHKDNCWYPDYSRRRVDIERQHSYASHIISNAYCDKLYSELENKIEAEIKEEKLFEQQEIKENKPPPPT